MRGFFFSRKRGKARGGMEIIEGEEREKEIRAYTCKGGGVNK